jgi:predicted XRE-type DNA-binding protein
MEKTKGNIFKDIGFNDAEAVNLHARSRLLILLEKEITRLKLTQAQVAKELGVSPPRVSELLNGKIDKFSLDLLVVYLARLGKAVEFRLRQAA